ncbi:MAG: endonuclease domain-containing protein [Ignavibacteria bacterium]|nr:endonuclease domain-containing protein [Ignavibacteria bacterium]MBK7446833.1 endonuclease domain-containing protein [Ignavibacteria bacterium]MBK8383914.1 endonuclease domain-containing protein [Ignavibacteria bacterium]MBK9405449.1 endonuclease domain-containing protein [Ignavibacteria bacterium]
MGIIFNQKSQNEKRKTLRNNMPQAEILLWSRLKGKKVRGLKFRRQFSVGKYVIDFYCPAVKLAIEADGNTHTSEEEIEYDKTRQYEIANFGITFLRFRNEDIIKYTNEVLRNIERKIDLINSGS